LLVEPNRIKLDEINVIKEREKKEEKYQMVDEA